MKTNHKLVLTALGIILITPVFSQTVTECQQNEAHAEAHAEASGNGSQTSKQTVTVTSDGKRTIKTTITERNGVRDVKREVTDENGRAIVEEPADDSKENSGNAPTNSQQQDLWLGVQVKAADPALREQLDLAENEGVVIELIADNSPAARAHMKVNDIIIALDEQKIGTPEELRKQLQTKQEGDEVKVDYLRKGQKATATMIVEKRPASGQKDAPPADKPSNPEARQGRADLELRHGESFDKILDDPQVPEHFKKSVREMQQRMKDFQDKHQPR
jgi:C-terminal processing protease CtpA/Prc